MEMQNDFFKKNVSVVLSFQKCKNKNLGRTKLFLVPDVIHACYGYKLYAMPWGTLQEKKKGIFFK